MSVALVLAVQIAFLWPTNGPARFFTDIHSIFVDPRAWAWSVVATIVVTAVASAVLYIRARSPVSWASAFLLVFAVWTLPRAVVVVWRLVAGSDPPFHSGSLVTLDTAVTAAVAILGLLWLQGRQRWVDPGALLLSLVVSTLIAHPGVLLPSGWKVGILFYLALAYGPAYKFLLDSRSLNRQDPARSARVLRAAGVAALLLVVASFRVATGQLGPGLEGPLDSFLRDVGRLFLIVPVGVVLVGGVIARRRELRGAHTPTAGGLDAARPGAGLRTRHVQA